MEEVILNIGRSPQLDDVPGFRDCVVKAENDFLHFAAVMKQWVERSEEMVKAGEQYIREQERFLECLQPLANIFADHTVQPWLSQHVFKDQKKKLLPHLREYITLSRNLIAAERKYMSRTKLAIRNSSKNILSGQYVKDIREVAAQYKEQMKRHSEVLESRLQLSRRDPRSPHLKEFKVLPALLSQTKCHASQYYHTIIVALMASMPEIVDTLWDHVYMRYTFYAEGYIAVNGVLPRLHEVDECVQQAFSSCRQYKEKASKKIKLDTNTADIFHGEVRFEGFLLKRSSGPIRSWKRRWFYLTDGQLIYKRPGETELIIMEADLRVCLVKEIEHDDGVYRFEIVSPKTVHTFQVENAEEQAKWVTIIRETIRLALENSFIHDPGNASNNNDVVVGQYSDDDDSPVTRKRSKEQQLDKLGENINILDTLIKIPGNAECCECREVNPRWASINLGITLCIQCAGIHRNLGVEYSKVRSILLDSWEPEVLELMKNLGNRVVNNIYEAVIPDTYKRPSMSSSVEIIEQWVRAKYVEKRFVKRLSASHIIDLAGNIIFLDRDVTYWNVWTPQEYPPVDVNTQSDHTDDRCMLFGDTASAVNNEGSNDTHNESNKKKEVTALPVSQLNPNSLLYHATSALNYTIMCYAIAAGANLKWRNENYNQRSHLHEAASAGSAGVCEYLLLNGADINAQDAENRTVLHLATSLGFSSEVRLFLRHKVDQYLKDREGSSPLDIAIRDCNPDIVTLLRLAQLNEQIGDENEDENNTW